MINVILAIPTTPLPLISSPTLLHERLNESTHVLSMLHSPSPLPQVLSLIKHFRSSMPRLPVQKQIAPLFFTGVCGPIVPMLNATRDSSQSLSALSAFRDMYPLFSCSSDDEFTCTYDTAVAAVSRLPAEGPPGIYTYMYICHLKPCNLQVKKIKRHLSCLISVAFLLVHQTCRAIQTDLFCSHSGIPFLLVIPILSVSRISCIRMNGCLLTHQSVATSPTQAQAVAATSYPAAQRTATAQS